LRQIVAPGTPAQRIARAIGRLKDHFAEPMRVEKLAKQTGLSPVCVTSAFQSGDRPQSASVSKAVSSSGSAPIDATHRSKFMRYRDAERLLPFGGLDFALGKASIVTTQSWVTTGLRGGKTSLHLSRG